MRSAGTLDVGVTREKFVIGVDYIMDIHKYAAMPVKTIRLITHIAIKLNTAVTSWVINAYPFCQRVTKHKNLKKHEVHFLQA